MISTKDILRDLIRIPSFIDKTHDECEIIKYVTSFIENKTKYKCVFQDVDGERKNILVYKKPNPRLALFGHLDTVLPKAETQNPFEPKEDGEKLYGLGSVDMKSGLAIMLKLLSKVNSEELALVFSVDEEYDFLGAQKLKTLSDFQPKFILNVEPTNLQILNGCRGITEFEFQVHGKSAHAGRKEDGVNAIEKSVELVTQLQTSVSKLDGTAGGKNSVNLAYLNGGLLLGNQEVGGMGNVVPNFAKLTCEIRLANEKITKKFIKNTLLALSKKLEVTIDNLNFKFYLGSMHTPQKDLEIFEEVLTGMGEPVVYSDVNKTGYFEVQMLQKSWSCPCLIFGPGPAHAAHTADEYVDLQSLQKAEAIIEAFISKVINHHHSPPKRV